MKPKFFAASLLIGMLMGLSNLHAQTAPETPEAEPFDATAQASALLRKDELETQIKARAEELERVNKELEETQKNLQNTKTQRAGLQSNVTRLLNTISQLELNIKADKIASQKLSLEIDSLNYDIRDIELSVIQKRETIGTLLRELQKKDDFNLLMVFLKSESLADGLLETQSLQSLRAQLGQDIVNLGIMQKDMAGKVQSVSNKKSELEFRQKNAQVRKVLVEDQKEEQRVVLAQTKNKESEYEKQLAELKKQQDAIEDEISKFENELRREFDTGLLPNPRSGVFDWPIALVADGGKGRITQHYGERSSLYRGKPHNGLDIGAPVGTPVVAADDGVVMAVDNNDRSAWSKYQYGKYVLIRHPNNLATIYAHLSRQSVSKGQTVKRGDLIGYSGNTGYSTGPHLHFGAYWAPSIQMKTVPPAAGLVPVGVVVKPEDYL